MADLINADAVVQQVRAGAPPTWRVLRAKQSYFIGGALGFLLLPLLAVVAAIYLVFSGTIVGIGIRNVTNEGVLTFWFIADMVVLAAVAVLGIVGAISRALAMGSIDTQVLVLMPEGFVQRTGTKPGQTITVTYANTAVMTRTIENSTLYLVVLTSDNRTRKLVVSNRFGAPKKLIEQIQAAHAAFAKAQPAAGQG